MPLLSTVGGASFRGFAGYNVKAPAPFIVATGGTVYVDPTATDYKVHEFTSSSNFSITSCPPSSTIQVMMVGGGGGGNYGGGGAGGYVFRSNFAVGTGTYSVVVGAGGAAGASDGGNTSFGGLVALGGGRPNTSGGSGGGGVDMNGGAGLQPTSATGGNGNAGGNWTSSGNDGGGGGAGGAGSVPDGGLGKTADIVNSSGVLTTFAAGGYGNSSSVSQELPAVVANSGNGGWGGGYGGIDFGAGQDGIVRIRYKFQ